MMVWVEVERQLGDSHERAKQILWSSWEGRGMRHGLAIRMDIGVGALRLHARLEADGRVAARLLAIANALSGMSRQAAAEATGMDRQTLRGRVHRLDADGTAGLADRPRSGQRTRLGEGEQAVLKAMILRGPDPERDGVSAWRVVDVCHICRERFGVNYAEAGMLQLMKGFDRKTVCPVSRGGSPYTAPAMDARVGRADPHRRRTSRGGMSNRLRWN